MKKLFSILALATIVCSGCTAVDAQKGTLLTMGDSTKFKADWKDGKMTHLEWDTNLHTPVTKAHYHGLIGLGAEAVAFGAGGPVVGTGVAAVTSFVNRPTSRAAPAK